MAKKAVLIGCNYPGTKAELKGCVNDVRRMYRCLVERYGFAEEHIKVLIDTDGSCTQPTGRNIRAALFDLVKSAKPGDFLFVHYSGHGMRLPAEAGEDDDTGYDECIVPTDMNLITDHDFRDLVNKVPEGCPITIVSDSCHSGGLIDEEKEQIGDSTRRKHKAEGSESTFETLNNLLHRSMEDVFESRGIHIPSAHHHNLKHHHQEHEGYLKNKSLPLSTLIEILEQKTGKHDIGVGKLRPTLFEVFGDDASPKVKQFMSMILSKLQNHDDGFLGKVGGLALQFLQQKLEEEGNEEYAKPETRKSLPDSGILVSGCQSGQTSADASPSGDASRAYGALSNAVQAIIAETGGEVSNRDLVLKARELLKRQGFTQRPGLYCSDDYVDAPFIC